MFRYWLEHLRRVARCAEHGARHPEHHAQLDAALQLLAKKILFTKRQANTRFINLGEQASDANLRDGLDSTSFATSSHVHSGADITSGTVAEARIDALLARDAEVFGIVTAADGAASGLDADLLDGMDSGAFEVAGLSQEVRWFKDAADVLALTTTSERVAFTAPEDITITDAFLEPAAALTASDTNYATVVVARRDANGGNKVTVASESTRRSAPGAPGTGAPSAPSRWGPCRTRPSPRDRS